MMSRSTTIHSERRTHVGAIGARVRLGHPTVTSDDAPAQSGFGLDARSIVSELRWLSRSGDYSLLLARSAQLAALAARSLEPELLARDLAALTTEGPIAALLGIESLVGLADPLVDKVLVGLLSHPEQIVRRHASWRLGDRQPSTAAVPMQIEMLLIGGIDTMHAHLALQRWSASIPVLIARSAVARLEIENDPAARARLVDLLGVVGYDTDEVLLHLALDTEEADAVRAAAVAALGVRSGGRIDAALHQLARHDKAVGTNAALALSGRVPGTLSPADRTDGAGLRVAQLVLVSGLDGQLSLGGRGDTGGVASLLVSLGEALAQRVDVDHVLTIGRGTVTDAFIGPLSSSRIPLTYGTVAFGDDARRAESANEGWEHLPAIERGIRRVLRLAGPVDLLHLRMADAGTLAGANVAAELGIPICFSLAPDPHNVIESLQSRGELDDASFIRLATETHVWFRARLIERLAGSAEQLALFPRSRPIEALQIVGRPGDGIDGEVSHQRVAIVAEGIDISLIDRAIVQSATACSDPRPGDVLDELADRIPPSRRGLPLVISVGRLNPVKGMDRIVSAWAADPRLHDTCSLVIVGGDLDDPSPTERAVLDTIEQLIPATDSRRKGLVLLGGRPRADIAQVMVATVLGREGRWASGGVYVDGALKEEFGLAVLEAMACGLVVVAPSTGGPSTYVDHGDTGILVDPSADLGVAIREAFGLVARAGRLERARRLVEQRYSIEAMADQLVDLYRPVMVSK